MVFATHGYGSSTGIPVSRPSWTPCHLLPHPTPLGRPRAPALGVLLHASGLHWLSMLHMTMLCFNAVLSSLPTLSFSHWMKKLVLYVCVSIAALYVGLPIPSLQIPHICISIQHVPLSFWLPSLCKTGSRFICLIRTDLNVFLFIAEWYSINSTVA